MTNTVNFPGLGLSFELNRVAFTVFGHSVYWYGIIIAAGFVLAVLYCYRVAWRFGIDKEVIFDLLIVATPLSILGARIYYVIFYLDLFRKADGSFDWRAAIAISDGGIAIYGAIITAIICVVLFCKARKINTLALLDLGCYGVIIGQIVGRWGNFVNVEAYGGVTGAPWRMSAERIANRLLSKGYLESQETYEALLSGELGVHPTFLYESLWNLVGLGLLILIAKKWRKVDGQIFLTYIIWYGVGRSIIEGMRTDSLYFFNTGLRSSQALGLLSAIVGSVWLLWRLQHAGPHAAPFVPASEKTEEITDAAKKDEQVNSSNMEQISEEENKNECDKT